MKLITTFLCLFLITTTPYAQNWLQKGGGASHDEALDVEVDASGNVYTTGYVTSTSVMGTTINLQTIGYSDIYVSKSNSSGEFLWAKTFGGPQADRAYDLALDNTGNIYITGYVTGTVIFDSFTVTTNNNSQDFFVAKLAPNGNVLWVNVQGGNGGENGYGVAIDSQSNVVVTGQFEGTAVIGNSTVTSAFNPDDNEMSTDIFIVKYASDGSPLWTRTGSGIYDDRGLAVDINANDEILLTGQFSDTLVLAGQTFNNEIVNAGYLLKMDPSGNNVWFRTMGAYQTMVYDVEVDNDRVYITGDFLGQMAIFGASDITFLTGDYLYKVFVIRFDQSGEIAWTQVDASDSPISSKAIAFDSNRDVYISGTFKCRFDEYAEELQGQGYFNSVGYRDVFISKYAQDDGNRLWMRQYGGPGRDYCSGIAVHQIDNPVIAGSYENKFSVPYDDATFQTNDNNFYNYFEGICAPASSFLSVNATGFKDVFIAQPVNLSTNNYYYYTINCFDDTIPIISQEDTLTFCGVGGVGVSTFTIGNGQTNLNHIGPYFSFEWNTGDQESSIDEIYNSGWYWCQIDRLDGCSSTLDSVFLQINPIPEIPPLTDETGTNIAEIDYQNITACSPDFIWVTFDLDTTVSSYFDGNLMEYQDTAYLSYLGNHGMNVTNEFGCNNGDVFAFEFDYPNLDTLVPYLTLESGLDSITICEGDEVTVNCLDMLTNPDLDPTSPFNTYVYPGNFSTLDTIISPTVNGWNYITFHPVLGYDNTCGTDFQSYIVSDSIFVTINPKPTVDFVLDGIFPFCPGDTTNAWTSTTYEGLMWSGPGIIDTNEPGDTIWAIQAGTYYYNGIVTDAATGCDTSITSSIILEYKPDPMVWSNMTDNLICPGDSLLLTCDPGLEYTWIGPLGEVIGSTQSIWVDLPGFYYCVLLDFESCLLTSNSIELIEYNSPFLIPEPGLELCHTGSIEITILHSGSPDFYWLDPINSNESVVVLEDPGTYSCEITQCGFTITESITIEDSGFEAYILAEDTLLCDGEEFVINSIPDMASYEWSNGVVTFSNQLVVSEPGTYDVFVTSPNGCTSQSESITVGYYDNWQFPVSLSEVICDSTSAVLTVEGTGEFTWYDSTMTNILAIADTLVTPILTESTTYYVIASDTLCTSSPVEVNVTIDAASALPDIQLDSLYCEGETVVFSTNNEGDYLWTLPDLTTVTTDQLIIENVSLSDAGTYSLQTSSSNCMSDVATATLLVDPQVSIALVYQDSVICQDSVLISSVGDYSFIDWSFNGLPIQSGGIELWGNAPGTYEVIVQNANETCSASDQVTMVNTSSLPAPEVVDDTICAGQTLEINLGILNPFWSTDPQLSDVQFTDTIFTGILTEDAVYYVGQLDEQGCYSELSLLNVEVTTSPAPGIFYNDPLCEGDSLVLYSNVPNASLEWTLPDNTTTMQEQLVIQNVTSANQGVYSVFAYDNECITESASIDVIVHSLPPVPIITGETSYCLGDIVSLQFQDFTAGMNYWAVNQYPIDSSSYVDSSATESFTVIATNYDGQCYSQIVLPISMNALPQIGNIYTNSPVCIGDVTTLATDEIAGMSYSWSGPANFSSTSSEAQIESSSSATQGIYSLTITDVNACSASGEVEVQVLLYPVIDLGEDTIICPGYPLLLTVADGYDSYVWNTGDFSNELLVEEAGIYSIEVANGSCWSSDEIEITSDCPLVFTPNIITPNGDMLNDKLFFRSPIIKTLNVYVYNRWGNLVGEWHDLEGYWDGKHYLTGVDLAEGTYFYVLDYIDIQGERHEEKKYITLVR